MKPDHKLNHLSICRHESLFNIDFGFYTFESHSFGRHFHNHYVIELVVSGADHFVCDGKMFTAGANELILINPGEIHTGSAANNEPLKYFCLYPEVDTLREIAEAVNLTLPDAFSFPRTIVKKPEIIEQFLSLLQSMQNNEPLAMQKEKLLLAMHGLLQSALAITRRNESLTKTDSRIETARNFLERYFKEEVTLEQVAAQVNLNPFHLLRLFKKRTGLTPHEYLLNLRTDHAKKLLKQGYSVEQSAIQSGFYDSSHLNRFIRKIAGTSPKSFLSSKSQFHTNFFG